MPTPDSAHGFGALLGRRCSTRQFAASALGVGVLGQLLWAGYGRAGTGRTVPSAHRLYALDLVVVAGPLDQAGSDSLIPAAAYRYHAEQHQIERLRTGDHRPDIAGTALADAAWLAVAPVLIVVSADLVAVGQHFQDQPRPASRGPRYVWTEFGHLSQNMYLQATDLGVGAVLVGGVDDEALRAALIDLVGRTGVDPLGIIAIGVPAED